MSSSMMESSMTAGDQGDLVQAGDLVEAQDQVGGDGDGDLVEVQDQDDDDVER